MSFYIEPFPVPEPIPPDPPTGSVDLKVWDYYYQRQREYENDYARWRYDEIDFRNAQYSRFYAQQSTAETENITVLMEKSEPEAPLDQQQEIPIDDYDQQAPFFQVPNQTVDFTSPYQDISSEYEDSSSRTTLSGRTIKMEKKTMLVVGLGGMVFFALIFTLAIYAKKRRIAAEKARDAIIVETPYKTGLEKQMRMGDSIKTDIDEKGNPMHSIPIGTSEKGEPVSKFYGSSKYFKS